MEIQCNHPNDFWLAKSELTHPFSSCGNTEPDRALETYIYIKDNVAILPFVSELSGTKSGWKSPP